MKLTKAQRACLTEALRGYVSPPCIGAFRRRSGEIGKVPGVFSRRVLRTLTEKGLLRHIDIETRAITPAGRAALGINRND